jgi:galactonate dehydratase
MKITGVTAIPTTPAGTTSTYVFVKVATDEGIVGWGESSIGVHSVAAVVEEFGSSIVGKDPFRIEEHWQHMYHLVHNVRGGALQMAAISGIEIALWDIKGQALNVPIYELMGGAMRDRIWGYGRFDGPTPEEAVERAQSFLDQGFTALKGDPFKHQGLFSSPQGQRNAIAIVAAVREAVGDDIELLIEVHGRLTPSEAIRFGDLLEPYSPFFYEEPVPPQNIDAMYKVAQAINIPLATGERIYTKWGFKELLEKQVVAVVQPDIGHAGGLSELKKIAAMAETYYVGIAPHNPYGPINTMAALHLDACTPNFLIQEGGHATWYDSVLTEPFPGQRDGYFDLPTGPGLGIAVDEDALLRQPAKPIDVSGDYRHQYVYPSRQGHHWI